MQCCLTALLGVALTLGCSSCNILLHCHHHFQVGMCSIWKATQIVVVSLSLHLEVVSGEVMCRCEIDAKDMLDEAWAVWNHCPRDIVMKSKHAHDSQSLLPHFMLHSFMTCSRVLHMFTLWQSPVISPLLLKRSTYAILGVEIRT